MQIQQAHFPTYSLKEVIPAGTRTQRVEEPKTLFGLSRERNEGREGGGGSQLAWSPEHNHHGGMAINEARPDPDGLPHRLWPWGLAWDS